MGVPALAINKIAEGSPHVLDWIERRDVDLVVNTPTGVGARSDGYEIRRAAVAHGIPCLTTLAAGISAARAIASAHRNGAPDVLCLQELHGAQRAPGARPITRPADGERTVSPDGAGVA
jgi:carbamoyl-phosphate synthase large subunit